MILCFILFILNIYLTKVYNYLLNVPFITIVVKVYAFNKNEKRDILV